MVVFSEIIRVPEATKSGERGRVVAFSEIIRVPEATKNADSEKNVASQKTSYRCSIKKLRASMIAGKTDKR